MSNPSDPSVGPDDSTRLFSVAISNAHFSDETDIDPEGQETARAITGNTSNSPEESDDPFSDNAAISNDDDESDSEDTELRDNRATLTPFSVDAENKPEGQQTGRDTTENTSNNSPENPFSDDQAIPTHDHESDSEGTKYWNRIARTPICVNLDLFDHRAEGRAARDTNTKQGSPGDDIIRLMHKTVGRTISTGQAESEIPEIIQQASKGFAANQTLKGPFAS